MYGYLKSFFLSNTQTPTSGNAAACRIWCPASVGVTSHDNKSPSCPWQCPAVTGCASCARCQSAWAWPQGRALVKRLKGIFTAGPRVKSAKGHHAHTNNKPFPEASSHTTMSAAAEMPHQAHGSLRRLSCAHPRQGCTPEMLLMPEFFTTRQIFTSTIH